MATVNPEYFNFGQRFQEGMDQARTRRLQDIALGQQQEDRAMQMQDRQARMEAMQQQQSAQQSEAQYAAQIREATTLLNATKALKNVQPERRRQALDQWAQRNPIIAGVAKQIPQDADLSDQGLDEFANSMGILVQGYGQPQGNSDFMRAIEIMRNPSASDTDRAAAEVALGLRARAIETRPQLVQTIGPDGKPRYESVKVGAGELPTGAPTQPPQKEPETTFGKEVDKQTAKRISTLQDTIPTVVDRLSALESVKQGFDQGRYSTGMENIAIPDWLQSSNNQELITKINQEVLEKAEQMKGALSDKDVAFLKASVLDINKGEVANKKILSDVIEVLRKAEQRANSELEHYQAGGRTTTFKPTSTAQPAASDQPKRLKYNPATGKLE